MTLGVGGLALVAVLLACVYTAAGSSEVAAGSTISSQVSQKVVTDEVALRSGCTAGALCWVWQVTPVLDCAQAVVGIVFSSENKDVLRSVTQSSRLAAGESANLVVPADVDDEVYAAIQQIRCTSE